MHLVHLYFITGMCFGIEFFIGDALVEGDKFAMNLDLGIARLTYIYSSVE